MRPTPPTQDGALAALVSGLDRDVTFERLSDGARAAWVQGSRGPVWITVEERSYRFDAVGLPGAWDATRADALGSGWGLGRVRTVDKVGTALSLGLPVVGTLPPPKTVRAVVDYLAEQTHAVSDGLPPRPPIVDARPTLAQARRALRDIGQAPHEGDGVPTLGFLQRLSDGPPTLVELFSTAPGLLIVRGSAHRSAEAPPEPSRDCGPSTRPPAWRGPSS